MARVVFVQVRSTKDQIFTLKQICEKSWDYAKDVFACSGDKLWRVLQEYGIDRHLLMNIKSLYSQPEVCVRKNRKQSKSFHLVVGLRQGCVLSPLLFIIYLNWMDKLSRTDECVTIRKCKISRLLFENDSVSLASWDSGLQHALNGFAAACDIAEMKISTSITEVLHLLRNPV